MKAHRAPEKPVAAGHRGRTSGPPPAFAGTEAHQDEAGAEAGQAALPRVLDPAAGAADRHAHLGGLSHDAEFAEQPCQQRVGALVVDDEPRVDGHLGAAGLRDQARVGVPAEPVIGLEDGHLVGAGQDVGCREPADAAPDDGDFGPVTRSSPLRVTPSFGPYRVRDG